MVVELFIIKKYNANKEDYLLKVSIWECVGSPLVAVPIVKPVEKMFMKW